MIEIKRTHTPDYENSGNLYHIEVTTDSFEEYSEAAQLLLSLQQIQQEKRNLLIKGVNHGKEI